MLASTIPNLVAVAGLLTAASDGVESWDEVRRAVGEILAGGDRGLVQVHRVGILIARIPALIAGPPVKICINS